MRRRFMEKGAEQGLWKAESFSAESDDGEEVKMESKMQIPFQDTLNIVRNDPFTLGLLCLSATSALAGFSVKDDVLQASTKSGLKMSSLVMGSFALGRLSRNSDVQAMSESFAMERMQMEQVLDMMEHDQEEKEAEARTHERRNFFDVGGGILNAFHNTMGSSLTNSNNAFTTRAHGQNPFSQVRY